VETKEQFYEWKNCPIQLTKERRENLSNMKDEVSILVRKGLKMHFEFPKHTAIPKSAYEIPHNSAFVYHTNLTRKIA